MKTSEDDLLSKNILDALASHIAIIDSDGTIQFVNKVWRHFALLNDGEIEKLGKGTNYLDICEQALGIAPSEEAVSALEGLREKILSLKYQLYVSGKIPSRASTLEKKSHF